MYSTPPRAETTELNIVNLKNYSYSNVPTKIGGTKLVNFIFDYQDLRFSNN
jgi:hypothetical protein